jgi:glycosyltransferase involved in cell wall biosynthesis
VKKRTLYVWQAQYPWDVRVEKICATLARNDFEVEVLARRGPGEPEHGESAGFAIHRVGSPSSSTLLRAFSLPMPGNPVWAAAIRARIRDFRPDLVIVRDIPLALPTAAACRDARVPWIIDMAEHYPVAMRTWKKYQVNPITRFAINTLKVPDRVERRAVLEAKGVLPVIDEQRDRLVQDYGCNPAHIVPVLNTPEVTRLPRDIRAQRRRAHFGYHGVVIQDRDLVTVVQGFDRAAARNTEIELTVAGSGESVPDIEQVAARSKYKDRIHITGRAFEPGDLAGLYDSVDFGIVPWTVNDFTNNTIANKFFDYAAFGKPIVFAETRPMVRLMKSMRFGFGYRGGDPQACAEAMLKLVDADYAALARAGRAAVEKEFNWDVDTAKLLGLIRKFI